MKKQSNTLFSKFSKDDLAHLTREVKETIAPDLAKPAHYRTFTAAELWNIQCQGKARLQRRYL